MPKSADSPAAPPITVRPADLKSPVERAAVAELLAEYAAALGSSLAEPAAIVVQRLIDDGRALIWLAWDGDRPCGLAVCFRLFSTFAARPTLNIHDLAVAGSHRSCGVGTQLIAAIVQAATTLGCSKVTLEVRSDNPAAERLYRRLGFVDPDGVPTRFLARSLS